MSDEPDIGGMMRELSRRVNAGDVHAAILLLHLALDEPACEADEEENWRRLTTLLASPMEIQPPGDRHGK